MDKKIFKKVETNRNHKENKDSFFTIFFICNENLKSIDAKTREKLGLSLFLIVHNS